MRASDTRFVTTDEDDPPVGPAGPESVTVGRFLEQWLPPLEMALKPSTFESYRCNVFHHINPRLGDRQLAYLSPLDLNDGH